MEKKGDAKKKEKKCQKVRAKAILQSQRLEVSKVGNARYAPKSFKHSNCFLLVCAAQNERKEKSKHSFTRARAPGRPRS